MHKYSLGHWKFIPMQGYIQDLYRRGFLGKGKQIECDLPMEQFGTMGFLHMHLRASTPTAAGRPEKPSKVWV
jgi:hypothetical protein